jgi:hypothetical protein
MRLRYPLMRSWLSQLAQRWGLSKGMLGLFFAHFLYLRYSASTLDAGGELLG